MKKKARLVCICVNLHTRIFSFVLGTRVVDLTVSVYIIYKMVRDHRSAVKYTLVNLFLYTTFFMSKMLALYIKFD